MSIRVVMHLVGALLALSIAAADGYSAPIFITIDAPPYFIPISDGGPGDLNPADGVIGFDQMFFFQNTTGTLTEEFELKGDVIYNPGTPIPGGQTGFGISLTNFSARLVMVTGTGSGVIVPRFLLNMEGTFSPGVPAPDLGFVTDHIDGSVTFQQSAGFRTFVTDLSTWTGDPPVSAGHAEIPIINTSDTPGNVVPFAFPDISSPLASGDRNPEIVHYELLLPDCLGQGDCSEFDLPGSGVAIVTAIPEPRSLALFGFGTLLLLAYGFRSHAAV